MKIGILVFDDAEELDFVGPWEALTMSNEMFELTGKKAPDDVFLISTAGETIKCAKGMRIVADYTIDNAPNIDVLLVPGGIGTRPLAEDKRVLDWVAGVAASCTWVTSVCTGSYVLAAAGPAKGKTVTTHWAFVDELEKKKLAARVRNDVRFVRDGNVVTAAGVSAGIDMALWLVGQMHGADHARMTQKGMQYDPAPPYAAEA